MKARLIPILLLLALLLAACGGEPAESAPSPTEPEETTETAPPAEEHLLPDLDLEEAQAMARFLNANRAFLQDGRLYCYDFGDDWTPALARYTWTKGSLKGFTVLAEGCIPEYLCGDGDYLYYIDRTSGGIERVPETGGERELLRKGPCEGLSLRDGRLYFCDGEGRFLSTDTEGKEETLLLSGPCSFAYPLDRGILYRALDLLDEQRTTLPEWGGVLELLPEETGLTVRITRDEDGPIQWTGGLDRPFQQEGRGYRICDWLGGGVRVDTVYESDGRIRCFLLTDGKGAEISFLTGRTN